MLSTTTAVLAAAALGAVAFVATSTDNFLLLLGLYAGRTHRPRDILLGYVGAVAAIVVIGRLLAVAAHRAPAEAVAYLGLIPIALGLWQLGHLLRGQMSEFDAPGGPLPTRGTAGVALLMLATSMDSLATYAALFADTRFPFGLVVLVAVVACATGMGIGARYLVHGTAVGERVRQFARPLVPFLLIGIGVYILANTPTDIVEPMAGFGF